MDQWKVMSTWCHHDSCKLVALELHIGYSYIVLTKLQELHMYMVSHTMSCNSCKLFDSTHVCKNMMNYNEL